MHSRFLLPVRRAAVAAVIAGAIVAHAQISPDYGTDLTNNGNKLYGEGRYEEALAAYQDALSFYRDNGGDRHPLVGVVTGYIGGVYFAKKNPKQALEYYKEAIDILSDASGPENSFHLASALCSASVCHGDLGEFKKQLELAEKANELVLRILSADAPRRGEFLKALAKSRRNLKDTKGAIKDGEAALSLYKSASEKGDERWWRDEASAELELATTYQANGQHDRALPLANKALQTYTVRLGADHPWTATAIQIVATSYKDLGYYEKAAEAVRKSLAIQRKFVPRDDPSLATTLNNLGAVLGYALKNDEAIPILEESLRISEKHFGKSHPYTSGTLLTLMQNYFLSGDASKAKECFYRASKGREIQLASIGSFDEETRQRLFTSFYVLDFLAQILSPAELGDVLIKMKGYVYDSLIRDKAVELKSSDKGAKQKLARIRSLRRDAAAQTFAAGGEQRLAATMAEIAKLQREVASDVGAGRTGAVDFNVSRSDILPSLGGSVFIDFFRYLYLEPNSPKASKAEYGALLIWADGKSELVRIKNADGIDDRIDALKSAIVRNDDGRISALTEELSTNVWHPIEEKIGDSVSRVFISGEGLLNFLSFASLQNRDSSFICEKRQIIYCASARDLARQPSKLSSKTIKVFADPQFSEVEESPMVTEMASMRSAEADVFGKIALPSLPGTKVEARAVEGVATQLGWNATIAEGDKATEQSIREASKPGVLHLATHGFYLNSFVPVGEEGTRGMSVVSLSQEEDKKRKETGVDPMRASGVALTGAQQTLKLWSQRKAPDPATDGILTAEEVASLDLDGTWLVTLSACETGVGEARSGEGVFGLRRAFMIAGAENLLMTLWPVADDTTAKIMADFYKEALASRDAPGSLAKVQRDWLVKLREEKGLATAIREAGPFAMVCMTSPRLKLEPKKSEKPDEVAAVAEITSGKPVPTNHEAQKALKEIGRPKSLTKADGTTKSKSAPKTVPKSRAKSDYQQALEQAKKQREKLKAIIEGSE
jgi:CHAT domain-containing protein